MNTVNLSGCDIAALLDQYGSLEQAYFNVVKK